MIIYKKSVLNVWSCIASVGGFGWLFYVKRETFKIGCIIRIFQVYQNSLGFQKSIYLVDSKSKLKTTDSENIIEEIHLSNVKDEVPVKCCWKGKFNFLEDFHLSLQLFAAFFFLAKGSHIWKKILSNGNLWNLLKFIFFFSKICSSNNSFLAFEGLIS